MKRDAVISMLILAVAALTAALHVSHAHATHYRGGLMTWDVIYSVGPPTTYGPVDVELVSLSLASPGPTSNVIALPESPAGELFSFENHFEGVMDIRIGLETFTVDSFFDVTYTATATEDPAHWDTEMVSMSLTGAIPGGPTILVHESPSLPSPGAIDVFDLPDGTFAVDSFFDVFTEISIDGGPYLPADGTTTLVLEGTVVPDSLPGDGNGDGWVDGLDYLLWAGNYATHPGPDGDISDGDYNDDGWVDGLDYLLWAGEYGNHAASAVPEPRALMLLVTGLLLTLATRRR